MQDQVKLKKRSLIGSFNYAFEGIIYVVRTQRNMKIHISAALIVLILGLFLGFNKIEFAILFILICGVLVAELLNTAIEATIDTVTTELDPLAKIAKDVAAAAVLVSAVVALIVGYILFYSKLNNYTLQTLLALKRSPIHLTSIALIVVFLVVVFIKAVIERGESMVHGGMPSVHAAISFGSATAIAFITQNSIAATLAILMALLVTESRLETGIHNVYQVTVGALLGIIITVLIFQLAG